MKERTKTNQPMEQAELQEIKTDLRAMRRMLMKLINTEMAKDEPDSRQMIRLTDSYLKVVRQLQRVMKDAEAWPDAPDSGASLGAMMAQMGGALGASLGMDEIRKVVAAPDK